jgi:hypothetical protein
MLKSFFLRWIAEGVDTDTHISIYGLGKKDVKQRLYPFMM